MTPSPARMRIALAGVGLACAAGMACAAPLPAQLWWMAPDGLHRAPALPAATSERDTQRVPLGSAWKLFAYAWLVTTGAQEAPYRCTQSRPASDDEYCCEPGGEVGRDEALARSCGPYFAARRLRVDATQWRRFWQARDMPAWVGSPAAFEPGTQVDVASLLDALSKLPAREAARTALLPLSLRLDGVVAAIGAGPRFKTWSWTVGGERAGGGTGWLADGTPFWFGAPGTSRTAWRAQAGWVAQALSAAGLADAVPDAASVAAEPCIQVALFRRYPLLSVTGMDGVPARAGTISGRQRLRFADGQALEIDASPGLWLATGGGVRLQARWPLEDYVARVVDREGDAKLPAAARSLAVAARSYLVQNATEGEGCRRIDDDSRTQRASPNPPSRAARDAAAFTRGLVLDGPPIHYHRDQADTNQMAWRDAVTQARAGAPFETILARAYPLSRLAAIDTRDDCTPLPEALHWLIEAQRRWRERLRREAGYEPLPETLAVCRLGFGLPHSDQRRLQIQVRDWSTQDGRVTLVHEYLHLAFRHHPHGQDERYVERLARELVDS